MSPGDIILIVQILVFPRKNNIAYCGAISLRSIQKDNIMFFHIFIFLSNKKQQILHDVMTAHCACCAGCTTFLCQAKHFRSAFQSIRLTSSSRMTTLTSSERRPQPIYGLNQWPFARFFWNITFWGTSASATSYFERLLPAVARLWSLVDTLLLLSHSPCPAFCGHFPVRPFILQTQNLNGSWPVCLSGFVSGKFQRLRKESCLPRNIRYSLENDEQHVFLGCIL